ncbi:hypothetical protein B296_00034767 [Ensete ventricosum]|uniref:Uncharacterized protein n=1 Tax=Ensete ventricosum TaxID=4639 RepID=A0A426XQC7_ENSVE|nr:hypothetical protein B296_00034767 [Ensete ventricosum]
MRLDLVGSSLGDLLNESGSSVGMRREIAGKKTGGLAARLPKVAGVCGSSSFVDKGHRLVDAAVAGCNRRRKKGSSGSDIWLEGYGIWLLLDRL